VRAEPRRRPAGDAPAGRPVRVEGISIFTCRYPVEQALCYDVLGMLQQVGATAVPT